MLKPTLHLPVPLAVTQCISTKSLPSIKGKYCAALLSRAQNANPMRALNSQSHDYKLARSNAVDKIQGLKRGIEILTSLLKTSLLFNLNT